MKFRNLFSFTALLVTPVFNPASQKFSLELSTAKASVTTEQKKAPKLVWISLDGLTMSDIEKYLQQIPHHHPRGFQYLIQNAKWNPELKVTNPTITASSHISTITCTPPGVHGVYANKQWNGTTMVSGFAFPFRGETFASSLKKQGLKVVTIGYVGLTDGNSEHIGSAGLGYDSPLASNKPLYKEILNGQVDSFSVPSRISKGESNTFEVKNTNGSLVIEMPSGKSVTAKLYRWTNLTIESAGQKEQVPVFVYKATNSKLSYYVGPSGMNFAFPDKFRKELDDANFIFSNAKDYSMSNVSAELYVQGLAHRHEYFRQASELALNVEKPDALFLYFEDLDTLGHQYAGYEDKDIIRAQHFARLDQTLGELISKLPASTAVVVMGDHGMSVIQYEININKVISPQLAKNYLTLSSGGAFFVYGKDAPVESNPPLTAAWFQQTVAELEGARVEFDGNRKIFSKVIQKGTDEAKRMGLDGPDMPWLVALADSQIGVSTSMRDEFLLSKRVDFKIPQEWQQKYPTPMQNGQPIIPLSGGHGHFNAAADMRTSLFVLGRPFLKSDLTQVNLNTDVVPFVADTLGLNRPAGCQNR